MAVNGKCPVCGKSIQVTPMERIGENYTSFKIWKHGSCMGSGTLVGVDKVITSF